MVAHGVTGREAAPEPAQFLQQLKCRLPEGTDMALAYFGAFPSVEKVLPGLKGQKVVVLPFLIGKGKHMREDMPSSELAARHGKTLKILPPFGAFYLQAEREYWKKTLPYFWKCPGRGCRFPMCWIRKPFQVCLKALTFKIFL